jgi:ribonuclease HI
VEFYLFCDGASRGNPGPAACAAIIYKDSPDSDALLRLGKVLGTATNNVAEYQGLILGLEGLLDHLAQDGVAPASVSLHIRMDSELIIRQLTGQYKVKHEAMKPLFARAKGMLSQFTAVRPEHVRREFNKEADLLANRHLDGLA